MRWELAAAVLVRPFLYLLLFAGVVYWVMRLAWKVIPPGRVRTFLFTHRTGWQQAVFGLIGFVALLLWIGLSIEAS